MNTIFKTAPEGLYLKHTDQYGNVSYAKTIAAPSQDAADAWEVATKEESAAHDARKREDAEVLARLIEESERLASEDGI